MKEVHVIAQGKGGVGKSLIAAIQASYLKERAANCKLYCYDTDPVNPTFSRHKALNVEVVKILTANNNIDSRNFDGLIEQLIENDGVAVVDNGAATFVPLMSYMAENQVPELLHESGVRLIVHVPMNGGQALEDCMTGLAQTLRAIDADVVVWLNDFKGEVKDGNKAFQDFKIYKEGQHRIIGVVHIPNRNPDTFGKDIQRMTELNLTFGEADTSPEFTLMPRQRLRTVKRDIYRQLDEITFLDTAAEVSDEQA